MSPGRPLSPSPVFRVLLCRRPAPAPAPRSRPPPVPRLVLVVPPSVPPVVSGVPFLSVSRPAPFPLSLPLLFGRRSRRRSGVRSVRLLLRKVARGVAPPAHHAPSSAISHAFTPRLRRMRTLILMPSFRWLFRRGFRMKYATTVERDKLNFGDVTADRCDLVCV